MPDWMKAAERSPSLCEAANGAALAPAKSGPLRASTTNATRALGLDTEGSPWRRIRGLVPLVGPVLLGSIGEVEERAMALEARGFSRPGRRSLLWAPADAGWERGARWLMVLSVPALVVAGLAGWLG